MDLRSRLQATLLLLVVVTAGGCAGTRGGMALQTRMSQSMSKLLRNSTELVAGGRRRMTSFPSRTTELGFRPIRRTRELWSATQDSASRLRQRLVRSPSGLASLAAGVTVGATQRTRQVVRRSKQFNPARMLDRFRDQTIMVLNSLDLSQPILEGRGDPHLSGDPAVQRRPSFLERLLQRL